LKSEDEKPKILIEDLFPYTTYYVRAAASNLGGKAM